MTSRSASMAGDKMSAPFTSRSRRRAARRRHRPELTASPVTPPRSTPRRDHLSSEARRGHLLHDRRTPAGAAACPRHGQALHRPIAISRPGHLHAAAFDRAGNFDTFTGVYKPPADTIRPSAITNITGTAGQAASR
jgi:hypothetical protein